jgi:hypothetical protein
MMQQQQQRPSTRISKQNAIVVPKAGWPIYFKFGNDENFIRKK